MSARIRAPPDHGPQAKHLASLASLRVSTRLPGYPMEHAMPVPFPPDPSDCRVAAQVICHGPQSVSVTGVAGQASGPGAAHICVRVGRVITYVHDREALLAHLRAWQRAAEMATPVFGRDLDDPFVAAEERARARFEKSHVRARGAEAGLR